MNKPILVFGHRGAMGIFPENTMVSFKEAEKNKADGIELDVHLSKDGEAVVIHDETLNRTTTMSGYVKDFTLEELKQADAGVTFHPTFTGERIPSLRDVLEWAVHTELIVNIELKNDRIRYEGLEEKVVELIREYRLEDRIILSSFNHESINRLKLIAPELERALLYFVLPSTILMDLEEKQEAGFHPHIKGLTKDVVYHAQQLGYTVRPYVANTEAEMKQLIDTGCDVIMSDYPGDVVRLLKEQGWTKQ